MAKIVGGVGVSHVPALGAMIDTDDLAEPQWEPIRKAFEPSRAWMRTMRPDVVIVIYGDHATAFSMDLIPTFTVACGVLFSPADEGKGPRPIPLVRGAPELAAHLADSLILGEFDIAVANEFAVDHGATVPLSLMFGKPREWPCNVIPLCVNVLRYPAPTANRCFQLGRAVRQAVQSFDAPLRVVIIGSGGMSHQLTGGRAGLINRQFDSWFLDCLATSPESLVRLPLADYVREAGSEGIELITWLAMRGSLNDSVDEVHRYYCAPVSNTALGHIILENA